MASTKRGPGAGNTEASGKNAPRKSKPDNSQARRKVQRKNPRRPAENHAGASTRRAYVVYNGREWLGTFVFNERTQQALAWDASRQFVGRFGSYRTAALAIGRTALTARQMAEARRRLDDPNPPFATGLPSHFLRCG
jgi:hypothetical protein